MGEPEPVVIAPWSDREVAALNDFQNLGFVHPFTCRCSGNVILRATREGWRCSAEKDCGYRQNWAWAAMADRDSPIWTNPLKRLEKQRESRETERLERITAEVEDRLGIGHRAWDTVEPHELASAFEEVLAPPRSWFYTSERLPKPGERALFWVVTHPIAAYASGRKGFFINAVFSDGLDNYSPGNRENDVYAWEPLAAPPPLPDAPRENEEPRT